MNIVLYARRLSSLAQSFKWHGKFSGDPQVAVRSYNASLIKLTRRSHMLVIGNLNCKNSLLYLTNITSTLVLHNENVALLLHIRYDTYV